MSKPSARARKTAKRDKLRKSAKAGNLYRKDKMKKAQDMLDFELAKATGAKYGDSVAYVEKMLIDIIRHLGTTSGTLNRLRTELLTGKIITKTELTVDEMVIMVDEEIEKMKKFKETKLRPIVEEMAKLKNMLDRTEQFLALVEFMDTMNKFQEEMNESMTSSAEVLKKLELAEGEEVKVEKPSIESHFTEDERELIMSL